MPNVYTIITSFENDVVFFRCSGELHTNIITKQLVTKPNLEGKNASITGQTVCSFSDIS